MARRRQHDAAKFLRSFGLKPIPMNRLYTEEYYEDICSAGVDPKDLNLFGSFSPQAGNVYFASERVASMSLSAEFNRLEGIMSHLVKILNTHPQIKQIADLGGGAGMISLYLASRFPDAHFTVYDHSPRLLSTGPIGPPSVPSRT